MNGLSDCDSGSEEERKGKETKGRKEPPEFLLIDTCDTCDVIKL